MKFSEAATIWSEHRCRMVELKLVADTTYRHQCKVAAILTREFGTVDLSLIRKSQVELFIGARLKTCQPVTVQGEISILHQILNWCVDEGHLGAKPRMPAVTVPNVEHALPPDELFLWILKHLPPKHGFAMEFMMLTGLSPHELQRTQKGDFVRPKLKGFGMIGIGKRPDFKVKQDSRRRFVHLNKRSMKIWMDLTAGLEPSDHPFPKRDALEKAIQRLRGPEAPQGIEAVTPKTMRAWFASKVSDDQPEHVLQRLMGHAPGSKVTRRHYVKSTEDRLVDAMQGVGA